MRNRTRVARIFSAQGVAAGLRAHFWIETIALISAIACILAIVIAALGAAAGTAAGEVESGQQGPSTGPSYEGVITDTHCGAKHSAAIGKSAADCTRVCVHAGEQFALVDGEAVYLLEGDLDALKRAAGQRVRIMGQLNGKTLSVTSVVAASSPTPTGSDSRT